MNLRWKIAQAAEIRWWQSYLKDKKETDYLAWKQDYWETFLNRIEVHPSTGETVLDVGCGPAGVFMQLKKQKVDAVDPLLQQYEEKLEHFDASKYPNTTFYPQPFEVFEVKKEYDTIFCLNAINHVSDLGLCFDKLVKATKKGGTLVVSIDAHNHAFFKHLFRLLPGDILHPHQYDLAEYKDMLRERNCEIIKTELIKSEFFFDYYALVVKVK